jgi:outer membrane receptor for ferrienterochelin and colicins
VVNGYESTTGQINVEYKKAFDEEQPRFFLNVFGDERGGAEANAIFKHKFGSKWNSMLMVHGRRMKNEVDRNDDGFMDIPDNTSINLYNRWNYHDNERLEGQINLKFLTDEINGGQTSDVVSSMLYKTNVSTKRAAVSGKLGFIFPEKPFKSIGNIVDVTYHDMKSSFGLKTYNAKETTFYLQSIYQNILWHTNHQYKAGITFRHDKLEQEFPGLPVNVEENIPGVFFEYTYNYLDKLTIVAGLREDLQPNKEWIFTPRLHGKYNFDESFIFRFSGGKSYRIPYLIADHISVLASSRAIEFREDINPERAWNNGINFTKRIEIPEHEITLSADLYRTDFIDQLVVDSYSDSTKISFYNLDGKSYSNSIQFTFNIELIELMNLRLAYKLDDVRSTFNGKLEKQPLTSTNKLLGTISYSTPDEHWKFDYTIVWDGKKKLQNVYFDPENNVEEYSPSFTVMNLQVTKVFKRFELYGGAENLLDYRQLHPIINPENPFGNSFDATNIWGPIQGRRIYAGIRYSIK